MLLGPELILKAFQWPRKKELMQNPEIRGRRSVQYNCGKGEMEHDGNNTG
jgi:hypothetical protein